MRRFQKPTLSYYIFSNSLSKIASTEVFANGTIIFMISEAIPTDFPRHVNASYKPVGVRLGTFSLSAGRGADAVYVGV